MQRQWAAWNRTPLHPLQGGVAVAVVAAPEPQAQQRLLLATPPLLGGAGGVQVAVAVPPGGCLQWPCLRALPAAQRGG